MRPATEKLRRAAGKVGLSLRIRYTKGEELNYRQWRWSLATTIDTQSLAFLVPDCSRLMRMAFEKRILSNGLGLTAGEARTLFQIAAHGNSRQLDIATRMGVEPMTVSAFLDRLQARGLIERQPHPQDRRAKRILLSSSADDMIKAISSEIYAVQAEATRGVDPETQETVKNALKIMRQNLQRADLSITA